MGSITTPLAGGGNELHPDAPKPGSEQWKGEREAEEMRGERRQGHGDAELIGEDELAGDPDEKKRRLSIELDPSMNP